MNLSRYFRLLAAGLALCLGAFSSNALAVTPMVAAGTGHTVALKSDGTVFTWGRNWHGELGYGTIEADHYVEASVGLVY